MSLLRKATQINKSVMAAMSKSLIAFLAFQAIFLFVVIKWSRNAVIVSIGPSSVKLQVKDRSELTGLVHGGNLPTSRSKYFSQSFTRDTNQGGTAVLAGNLPTPWSNFQSQLVTRSEAKCDRPVTNFVFIKVHKTASGSTFMVLGRFGRNHDMTICYPARRSKARHKTLSYPSGKLIRKDCNPAYGRNYTLLLHHSIMNKPAMDGIMEPGTKYIGIMREPLSHFRSIFFWEQRILRHKTNPLGTFLNINENFDLRNKQPYSKHRNFQAHYLGFPTKYMTSKNTSQLYEAIRTVAGWYSMVIITEYWEESLVLLRRTFCWTMFDILHSTRRLHRLKTRKERVTLTDKQKETHKRMSNIDYMMYDYFNNTFWQRVSEEGPEFWEEFTYYRTLNGEVNQHCNSARGEKVFPAGKWSREFVINSTFCHELRKWGEGKWAVSCRDVVNRQNEEMRKKNPQLDE
ncbi:galactose-3-O-sulfotransferase 3-like [Branchiostoma floridae]|uniref:Galactose-3-O-sulfotransferase 3-like n=1 Tax=Branchiostoma floridae TaxID=7739 RepID=A0A9J7MVR2_BRAFL|nr:galactose-3-O-sulfotransferase 3-like [Branchiostoma floridae]